jgi:DNA recombination protein RmuC
MSPFEITLVCLCIASVLVSAAVLYFFFKKSNSSSSIDAQQLQQEIRQMKEQFLGQFTENAKWMSLQIKDMGQQVGEHVRTTSSLLERTNQTMGERLEGASRAVNEISGKLSRLEEANKRIYDIGKDISSLQEILRAPKLRGVLGELLLGDLLAQIFPPDRFFVQYGFQSGEKVDAVIVFHQGLVSIDAKFPLENFKRLIESQEDATKVKLKKQFTQDVKKHIDDIARKYILPDEGTFNFAFMYIPAENVYYEVIIKDDKMGESQSLIEYALSKRVVPTSPNTFYAYLNTVLLGLKGMRIEAAAQEILKNISSVHQEFEKFQVEFEKIGSHLNNSMTAYGRSEKRLERTSQKLQQLNKGEEIKEIENTSVELELDKPS